MKELTQKLYATLGLVVMLVVGATGIASAQSEAANLYVRNVKNQALDQHKKTMMVPLSKVLEKIGHARHITFVYESDLIKGKIVSKTVLTSANLAHKLGKLLAQNGLTYKKQAKGTYVIKRLPMFHGMTRPTAASQVSGTVTDGSTGETLPGVNIAVKGTTTGTATDAQGQYELTVESLQDTLVFSFVGYQTRQVPINGRAEINITMQPQTISGEEMVVVGYGTQKKSDLTGSIDVVDVPSLSNQPSNEITKQLQGQAPGVTVVSSGQPGEEPTVRIRGVNTFGNNTPLYIVDGIPTQNISDLDPQSVASMQVLKDASAASIYGSRAANGVILITTKKGKGEVSITYKASIGMQVPPSGNVLDKLDPKEQAELKWLAEENSGITNHSDPLYGSGDEPVIPDYILPAGASEGDPSVDPSLYYVNPNYKDISELNNFYQIVRANKSGTNWFDELFKPAATTKHNLSISGGSKNANYLFSIDYQNKNGTMDYTSLRRYGIRANTQFDIGKNIHIGENLQYTIKNNPSVSTLNEGSPPHEALRIPTIVPVHDIQGNFAGTAPPGLGQAHNPVAEQYRTRNNKNQNNRLFGNVFAEVDFWKFLTFRTNFGGDILSTNSNSFSYPSYELRENGTTNSYSEFITSAYNYTWSNTLNFNSSFGNHNLKFLAGTEVNIERYHSTSSERQGYFSFDPNYTNLSTGSGIPTASSQTIKSSLLSFFGRLDYNYNSKYLASATLRRDGSSKFLENRYGLFPAFSLGWEISEEPFMQNISWVSDLKIRGSWGILGNQLNVNAANSFTTYGGDPTSTYYDFTGSNSSIIQGFSKTSIGNADAKWEKNISSNIGLNLSLLRSKIQITADYYQKIIKDLLYSRQLAATYGAASPPTVNIAKMSNNGVDFSISSHFDFSQNFSFNPRITFTSYSNKIKKVTSSANFFSESTRRFGLPIVRNQVGHAVGQFYGYDIVGFWDTRDEINKANSLAQQSTGNSNAVYQDGIGIGRFRYKDTNDDGQITSEDRTFLGNPNPDFTYGVSLGFNYKNFDLNMFFYGSQGNDIWDQTKWWTDFYPAFQGAKSKTALYDSWTPDNKNAKVAIQEVTASNSTSSAPNSYYIEDGSYLRLKNLQLGYKISPKILTGIGLKKLRIYLQGANLFTITNYSGPDPEIGGNSTTVFGIDEGAYITSRQFMVGISIAY